MPPFTPHFKLASSYRDLNSNPANFSLGQRRSFAALAGRAHQVKQALDLTVVMDHLALAADVDKNSRDAVGYL